IPADAPVTRTVRPAPSLSIMPGRLSHGASMNARSGTPSSERNTRLLGLGSVPSGDTKRAHQLEERIAFGNVERTAVVRDRRPVPHEDARDTLLESCGQLQSCDISPRRPVDAPLGTEGVRRVRGLAR